METNSKYDGLVIKTNDDYHSGYTDCELCCFSNPNPDGECDDCPLKRGFYFAESSSDSFHCSGMSDDDKFKLDHVVKDLYCLADNLKSSRDLSLVLHSTIRMAISTLELQLHSLSLLKTFDK